MSFPNLKAKITYVPDQQTDINLRVLHSILRKIILAEGKNNLEFGHLPFYNKTGKGTEK